MDENTGPLEDRIAGIEKRIARLESFFPAVSPAEAPKPAAPAAVPPPPPPAPVHPRKEHEERDYGRVIAWAGGLAFTTGIVLLVSLAVERGWIGPGVRFVLGLGLALAATALSVVLSSRRTVFAAVVENPATRLSVARTLFVAGLVGGYAASYAGFARWDLFGFAALSVLIGILTFLHLGLGHLSGDIVRAGSAIAGAFLVPIYAEDLASVQVEAWPAVILFAGGAVLAVVWSRRSGSITAWILGTIGVGALHAAVEGDLGAARVTGIWLLAAAATVTIWMIGRRLATDTGEFSVLDALLVGWLALAAGGYLTGWAFAEPTLYAEIGVVISLGAAGFVAYQAKWREVADGLTVAATVFAFLAIEALSDESLPWMASVAAVLIVAVVWWAGRLDLTLSRFTIRGIALVIGVITTALLAFPVLDDRAEVVLSGGVVLLALAVAAYVDDEILGRWIFGTDTAVVWVAWWAALSGLTFEPDAITTAGWFATAIGAIYVGRQKRIRALPIAGLVLGGVSYLKLFLYDLSAVEPALRIILFLVVGAALVGFAYRSERARTG